MKRIIRLVSGSILTLLLIVTASTFPAMATYEHVNVSSSSVTVTGLNDDQSGTYARVNYELAPEAGQVPRLVVGVECMWDGATWYETGSTGSGNGNGHLNVGSFTIGWGYVEDRGFQGVGLTKIVVIALTTTDMPDTTSEDYCNDPGAYPYAAVTDEFIPEFPLEVSVPANDAYPQTLFEGQSLEIRPVLDPQDSLQAMTALSNILCVRATDGVTEVLDYYSAASDWSLTADANYGFLDWDWVIDPSGPDFEVDETWGISLGTCLEDEWDLFGFSPVTPELEITYSAATVPGLLSSLTGGYDWETDSIELQWSVPASDGGTPITGYQVCVEDCDDPADTFTNDYFLGASETSLIVENPIHGMSTSFSVLTLNAVGPSAPYSISVNVPMMMAVSYSLGIYAQEGVSAPPSQNVPLGGTLTLPAASYPELTFLGWSANGGDPVTGVLEVGENLDLTAVFSENTVATLGGVSLNDVPITLVDGNTYYANHLDTSAGNLTFQLDLPLGATISSGFGQNKSIVQTGSTFRGVDLGFDGTLTISNEYFCLVADCSTGYSRQATFRFTVNSQDGQSSEDYEILVAKPISVMDFNFQVFYENRDATSGDSFSTETTKARYVQISCEASFERLGFEVTGWQRNDLGASYSCGQIIYLDQGLWLLPIWSEVEVIVTPPEEAEPVSADPTSIRLFGQDIALAPCSNTTLFRYDLCMTPSGGEEVEPYYDDQFLTINVDEITEWSPVLTVAEGVETTWFTVEFWEQGSGNYEADTNYFVDDAEDMAAMRTGFRSICDPSDDAPCAVIMDVDFATESVDDYRYLEFYLLVLVNYEAGATADIGFQADSAEIFNADPVLLPGSTVLPVGWQVLPDLMELEPLGLRHHGWISDQYPNSYFFPEWELFPVTGDETLYAELREEISINFHADGELIYSMTTYQGLWLEKPEDFPNPWAENSQMRFWSLEPGGDLIDLWGYENYEADTNWYAGRLVDELTLTRQTDEFGDYLEVDVFEITYIPRLEYDIDWDAKCGVSQDWIPLEAPVTSSRFYLLDAPEDCLEFRARIDFKHWWESVETGTLAISLEATLTPSPSPDSSGSSASPSTTSESQPAAESVIGTADSAIVQTRQIGYNFRIGVFNLVGQGKVQIFQNGREIAWVRATSAADPKLRKASDGSSYFVRNRPLKEGANLIEIKLNGETISKAEFSK